MLKLESIIKAAEEVKGILCDCKTISDVYDLSNKDIDVDDYVSCVWIGDEWYELDQACERFSKSTAISGVRLETYDGKDVILDYPTWDTESNELSFDVVDLDVDNEKAVIEDATLKTITKLYNSYVKEMAACEI